MDGEIRDASKQKTDVTEDLSPEAKRLIELKVNLGQLKTAEREVREVLFLTQDRHRELRNNINYIEDEIMNLEQGQLVL